MSFLLGWAEVSAPACYRVGENGAKLAVEPWTGTLPSEPVRVASPVFAFRIRIRRKPVKSSGFSFDMDNFTFKISCLVEYLVIMTTPKDKLATLRLSADGSEAGDTADQIGGMCLDLSTAAKQANQPSLAYLLGMAAEEAQIVGRRHRAGQFEHDHPEEQS